jgi:hypothetical protein
MKVFSFILKQVYYKFVYTQLLLQANPTGLLEVQLPGDLLRTMCGSRTGGRSLPCVMSD